MCFFDLNIEKCKIFPPGGSQQQVLLASRASSFKQPLEAVDKHLSCEKSEQN